MTPWLVFRVGEVLACEQRWLGNWADWLGVPRHSFFAALGAIIAARRPYTDVFAQFRPGIDVAVEQAKREALGIRDAYGHADLYPDAVPTLRWAHEAGYRIGIAGNIEAASEDFVRSLALPVDFIGSAGRWGVWKPDPAFFRRILAETQCDAAEVTYIGDIIENDIVPPLALGMNAIHVARGRGVQFRRVRCRPDGRGDLYRRHAKRVPQIRSLTELPALMARG